MSIFGGNTGLTYEDVERKRAIAKQMAQANGSAPRNVGEGIHAIGRALAGRALEKRASARDAELRGQFNDQFSQLAPNMNGLADMANSPYASEGHQKVIEALMKGAPNYKRGGVHPGGVAVVGENGPEAVVLPPQSQVMPNNVFQPGNEEDDAPAAFRKMTPEHQRDFLTLTPDDKQRVLRALEGPEPQVDYGTPSQWLNEVGGRQQQPVPAVPQINMDNAFPPGGAPQSIPPKAPNFIGGDYQDVDSGQIATDAYPIQPSGVGEQTQINNAVNAYRSILTGLDDYNSLVQDGGVAVLPSKQKDSIDVSRRHLQMQMKELYNLGVLNGPDLELMDTILLNPNGVVNKILDITGVADTESRVASNVELVKKLMTEMVEPKLKSMGLTPEDVAPKGKAEPDLKSLDDDALMKILTGG